jgi:fructokinase
MLGAKGIIVSRIGGDALGDELIGKLDALRLEKTNIQRDAAHPTGTVTVTLNEQGMPRYIIHENVAWDFIENETNLKEIASRADAVCFGSLAQRSPVSRETIRSFLDMVRKNCLRVMDVNLRQAFFNETIIGESFQRADVVKLNDEEFPVVAEMLGITGTEPEILESMLDNFSLRLIALTRGENGARLISREEDSIHPGFMGTVADTVGAGDAFTAALVYGLLRGESLNRINDFANRLAAYVCTQNGGTPDVPDSVKSFDTIEMDNA